MSAAPLSFSLLYESLSPLSRKQKDGIPPSSRGGFGRFAKPSAEHTPRRGHRRGLRRARAHTSILGRYLSVQLWLSV